MEKVCFIITKIDRENLIHNQKTNTGQVNIMSCIVNYEQVNNDIYYY